MEGSKHLCSSWWSLTRLCYLKPRKWLWSYELLEFYFQLMPPGKGTRSFPLWHVHILSLSRPGSMHSNSFQPKEKSSFSFIHLLLFLTFFLSYWVMFVCFDFLICFWKRNRVRLSLRHTQSLWYPSMHQANQVLNWKRKVHAMGWLTELTSIWLNGERCHGTINSCKISM